MFRKDFYLLSHTKMPTFEKGTLERVSAPADEAPSHCRRLLRLTAKLHQVISIRAVVDVYLAGFLTCCRLNLDLAPKLQLLNE